MIVDAVQRPRGPMGWSPTYAHLGWPGDVTAERIEQWRLEYMQMSRAVRACADVLDEQLPRPDLSEIPEVPPPDLTGRIRFRVGWRKRLVLQVEHVTHRAVVGRWAVSSPRGARAWRDATIVDLQMLPRIGSEDEPDGHR